jgi:hypothetical protein
MGYAVSVVVDNTDSGSSSAAIEGLTVLNFEQATLLEDDIAIATWWHDVLLIPRLATGHHALLLQRMGGSYLPAGRAFPSARPESLSNSASGQ